MYANNSFAGTGVGAAISARRVLVGVTGTFSATVKIKWVDASGTVHTVQENDADLSFTAVGERVIDFAVPVRVYAECTAFSSGPVVVSLSGTVSGLEVSVCG